MGKSPDENKTKQQLIKELQDKRGKITELEIRNPSFIDESLYKDAEKLADLGFWSWDIINDIFTYSAGWKHILGFGKNQLSMDDVLSIAHPVDVPHIKKELEKASKSEDGTKHYVEHRIIRQNDGELRFVRSYGRYIKDRNGNSVEMHGVTQDITDQKESESRLIKSEKEKDIILNSTSEQIIFQDRDYKIKWCNKAAAEFMGLDFGNLTEQYCFKIWHNSNIPCQNCPVAKSIETGRHYESKRTSPDGRIWYIKADPVKGSDGNVTGAIKIANEITDKIKTEEKIREYSKELKKINAELEDRVRKQTQEIKNAERTREMEIHHRIKNNLQVISSLLSLQESYFDDKDVIGAFKDSQNRVISMALAHENLYQSADLENISFSEYIKNLFSHLYSTYNPRNISFRCNTDDIYFGIDTIIPLGMIVNELISNSMKYAFPDMEQGEINVEIHQENTSNYILIVSDNGKGIPEDIDIWNVESLGLNLVCTLVNQINGDIELDRDNGSRFTIKFND